MKAGTATVLVVATAGILALAPVAGAQPAVSQYVPSAEPTDAGAQQPSDAGAAAPAAGEEAVAGEAGATLPFTGYPLTPALAIVAALLAAGIGLRLAAAAIERRRTPADG